MYVPVALPTYTKEGVHLDKTLELWYFARDCTYL